MSKYVVTYRQSDVHVDEPCFMTDSVRKALNTLPRMRHSGQRVLFYRSQGERLLPVAHFYWDSKRWRPLRRLVLAFRRASESYAKEHNKTEENAMRVKSLNIEYECRRLLENRLLTKHKISQ